MAIKVGIITNEYEVPRVQSLVEYLESRGAEVTFYVEERVVVSHPAPPLPEDVFFTKGKGYVLLTLARLAEEAGASRGVPVVNSWRAIWVAMHRFMHCLLCDRAGVRVAPYSFGRAGSTRFGSFIAKNVIDQNHLRLLAQLPIIGPDGADLPSIPTGEEAGTDPRVPEFHFFQKELHSEYEYKVYGFGDQLFFYRQAPVLVNPNKRETRVPIDPIPELETMARRAMTATGLRVASIDFLEEGGKFYLTDINAIPNFNYMREGPRVLGDYLLELARHGGKNPRSPAEEGA